MIDSCSLETKGLISIDLALKYIKDSIKPLAGVERVVLKKALGRVLSDTVISPINIPPEDNSAMDGYAFAGNDIKPSEQFSLTNVGTSWAGTPYSKKIPSGACVRIFTGAVIPEGADSVIMQELVHQEENKIIFPKNTIAKENIRQLGTDISINSALLNPTKKLTAPDLGLLASAGIYDVPVNRKLNIAFFSTGDELCSNSKPLQPGQIYDSNRFTLHALLSDPCFSIHDLGVIADNKQLLEDTLIAAANTYDVIISTGGASVGDADYIKEILDKCGDVGFWKIAMKPGKPLAFGKIKNSYFFGLPGNPVSVIATFQKIVLPALQQLSGIGMSKQIAISAVCTSNLRKQKGRQEYQRGILTQTESGEFFVESAGKQGSNIMSAMSLANCYIVLPIDSEGIQAGQMVQTEPFSCFL